MNIATTCRSQECFLYSRKKKKLQSFVQSMVDFGGIKGVRVLQELYLKDNTCTISQSLPHEASLWPVGTWPTLLPLTHLVIFNSFIALNILQTHLFANLPTCPDVPDPLGTRSIAIGVFYVASFMAEFPWIPYPECQGCSQSVFEEYNVLKCVMGILVTSKC